MWEEKQTENVFCENKSCLFLLISTKKKKKKGSRIIIIF